MFHMLALSLLHDWLPKERFLGYRKDVYNLVDIRNTVRVPEKARQCASESQSLKEWDFGACSLNPSFLFRSEPCALPKLHTPLCSDNPHDHHCLVTRIFGSWPSRIWVFHIKLGMWRQQNGRMWMKLGMRFEGGSVTPNYEMHNFSSTLQNWPLSLQCRTCPCLPCLAGHGLVFTSPYFSFSVTMSFCFSHYRSNFSLWILKGGQLQS